ncbi:MAG: PepSY domain-containing protein [Candidatus Polarisedimenticolaceae bacterium]|nr:PepSY domain-containing protein [Candidatus Polarisedimenticolaceae bacterium]
MNKLQQTLLTLALACWCSVSAADDDHLKAKALVEVGSILPLEQILKQVAIDRPGHILEVEFELERGQYLYEIELVDKNGLVWELEYDAQSGQLIEMEREE